MKKIITVLLCILLVNSAFSQSEKILSAQLLYTRFFAPDEGPFIETSLLVVGKSVVYVKNENDKFQGSIEVTVIFSKDSTVVNFDKYELFSPEVEDTTNLTFNFIDQQRYGLPNGLYEYELKIKDVNSRVAPFSTKQTIEIDFPENQVSISGIQMVESYKKTTEPNILSKSGYDIVPFVFNFYPDPLNSLRFYVEIYNTEKAIGANEKFLLSYYIENYESKTRLSKFVRFKKEDTKQVNVLFTEFEISELPSGNYYLVIEARNKENELLDESRQFFQRSNPDVKDNFGEFANIVVENSFVSQITNKDTLVEYIHCLAPISTDMEMNFVKYQVDKDAINFESMQRYFLNFWLSRDELNPEYAWKKYLSSVQLVDEQFGYPGKKGTKGYDTDMGRTFLKYGPPNTITDRPFDAGGSGMTINDGGVESSKDGGSVPYQIWHYYELNGQRDIKFVFANINIALFDYTLIHSNLPGEINNVNWQNELKRHKQGVALPDEDKYTGRSGDDYNNPR